MFLPMTFSCDLSNILMLFCFLTDSLYLSPCVYICISDIHIYIYIYLYTYNIWSLTLPFSFLQNTHTHTFHSESRWIPYFLNTYLKGKNKLVLLILLDWILIAECPISIYLLLFTEEWINVMLLSYSCILKFPSSSHCLFIS